MGKRQYTVIGCQEGWQKCWQNYWQTVGLRRLHVERSRSGWMPVLREKLPRLNDRWPDKLDLYQNLLQQQNWHGASQFGPQAQHILRNIQAMRTDHLKYRFHAGERELRIDPFQPCIDRREHSGAGGHRAARRILRMRGIETPVRYGPRWQSQPNPTEE